MFAPRASSRPRLAGVLLGVGGLLVGFAPFGASAAAAPARAHDRHGAAVPAVSEQRCLALQSGMSWNVTLSGAQHVGGRLTVQVRYACGTGGAPSPLAGMATAARVLPGTVARLVSPASVRTNAKGTASYRLLGETPGAATLEIRIVDGGLCASAFGAAHCIVRVPVHERPAPGLPPAHPARRAGILPPAEPVRNAPSSPYLPRQCPETGPLPRGRYNKSLACAEVYLRRINAALAAEHAHAVALPRNWARLTIAEQLFVMADLERVARGLPPYVGLSPVLDRYAQAGAVAGRDPGAPRSGIDAAASNWAGGVVSAADADYGWVYLDGWGGSRAATSNLDCTSPRASGCWGHRDNVLGRYTGLECTDCVMGAGAAFSSRDGGTSLTELFVEPRRPGEYPLSFTWKKDVLPFLAR